jgi:poly(hydroxyalkanoate) depolymerase family esterase
MEPIMHRRLSASVLATRVALAGGSLLLASCSGGAPGEPGAEPTGVASAAVSTLTQVASFGSNPGNLLMFDYVPAGMPSKAPLVLALHGCTETADDYLSAGWNSVADQYKFYVLYPQQQSANNTESCFNWFGNTSGSTEDITRGEGEAASIISMIKTMESTYSIDPTRVFVTGFSAGAAYAVALLAMYPDVFAAGASFSGLPFGCANSLATAETCMSAPPSKTAAQWGMLAQAGFPGYAGPYPRLSVWQGSDDTTVSTQNLAALVSQWTDLTGASATPSATNTVAGFPHNEYSNGKGVQVESYSITSMSHAVAIDPSSSCGTAGTYFIDEKLCAVSYVAQFFGLEGSGSGGGSGSSSGSGSGGSSSGGSGGSGSSGSSSGGAGSSSGGAGGSGSGGAPDDDAGTSGSSSGAVNGAAGVDAGAVAPADLPGCSMSTPRKDGNDMVWMLAGLALGLVAVTRVSATRRNGR